MKPFLGRKEYRPQEVFPPLVYRFSLTLELDRDEASEYPIFILTFLYFFRFISSGLPQDIKISNARILGMSLNTVFSAKLLPLEYSISLKIVKP